MAQWEMEKEGAVSREVRYLLVARQIFFARVDGSLLRFAYIHVAP